MIETRIADGWFRARLTGWDAIWALRREIGVPLAHISGAHIENVNDIIARYGPMQRMGGTWFVGKIMAGQFTSMRKFIDENGIPTYGTEWVFWSVRKAAQVVVINLVENSFSEVVLEVPDPDSLVRRINESIPSKTGPAAAV